MSNAGKTRDKVLLRMLKTPPKEHAALKVKRPKKTKDAKRAAK